jgi:RNA polymerase sigma factor (sigma-70 family)
MATGRTSKVIEQLRRAVLLHDGAAMTDGELMGCFIEHREEAAFAALVRRHAPLVWGVCRRLLDHHDAEDAFQATFLVLARKAASVVPREMLANWLYGVAHQAALHARRTVARRRARERQVTEMPEPAVSAERDPWDDLRPLLDQELSRLPDKYRVVLALSDLEGKTRGEAARQLGLPEGTVASRLARARAMLAKRLAQRGVALSGGALAAMLSQKVASAGVPLSVVESTITAASLVAAGKAASGAISVKAAAFAEGVLKTMLNTKLKAAIAVILVLVLVATGATILTRRTAAGQGDKKAGQGEKKPSRSVSDQDKLQGTWRIVEVIVDGQPARRQNPTEEANMVVQGDQMSVVALPGGKKVKEFRFGIDPAKMPRAIDLSVPTDQAKGKTAHGIYELEGDQWKLCFPQDDNEAKERPMSFKSEAGSRLVLMTLKRDVKR